MSALIGPAKAARILGEELDVEAGEARSATVSVIFNRMSAAYIRAADRMEQMMREEAQKR